MTEPTNDAAGGSEKGTQPAAPKKQGSRKLGDGWLIGGMVFASIAIIGVIMGWAFTGSGGNTAVKSEVTASTKTVEVELGEFYVKPGELDIAPGTSLILKVTNKGTIDHDLKVNNLATPMLKPGKSAILKTGQITATTKGWCTVPGHEAAGMKMDINVKSASGDDSDATNQQAGSQASGFDPNDAKIDFNAKPAKSFKATDPTLTPAPEGTVHNVTFEATDKLIEVSPGVTQMLWTFNDTVPGPTLRGKVGDTFNVKLVNKGTVGHSLDFHASQTAMDVNMRTIQPGESLTYTFTAAHTGVWMYHCGTPPVIHHIANGMFGAVVIDPPDLDPVDHEYLFVQSEYYLGPKNKEADMAKAVAGQQDAVVFNGYANQYVFDPIKVKVGERIRVFVLDVGPNEISAFHIVGLQFDTTYKEGAYMLRANDPLKGGAQVLGLMPAEGGFIETVIPEKGTYALVSHKFNDASRGAAGHFVAEP